MIHLIYQEWEFRNPLTVLSAAEEGDKVRNIRPRRKCKAKKKCKAKNKYKAKKRYKARKRELTFANKLYNASENYFKKGVWSFSGIIKSLHFEFKIQTAYLDFN